MSACATGSYDSSPYAGAPPPHAAYSTPYRPAPDPSPEIAKVSMGIYAGHFDAEVVSARYADVGGAVIEPVDVDGRREWQLKLIGRIGESRGSLESRIAAARAGRSGAYGARLSTVSYVHHPASHARRRHRHPRVA